MRNSRRARFIVFGALVAVLGCCARAGVVHVSATAGSDGNDGSSWALAKATIQAGVDTATAGDAVLVSNGTYNTGGRVPPGQSLCQARVVIDKAVWVSSVNGPSNTFIVGVGPRGDSAVRCVWMTNDTYLAGFTLTNGYTVTAIGGADEDGGGVYAADTSVISNCIIQACEARNGAATARGSLANCTLSGNSAAERGGGAYEGTLDNCTLSGNSAYSSAGGACSATLTACTLSGNSADNGGGAYRSTLTACTLSGNSASSGGGAWEGTLNNCTLSGNSVYGGGGGAHGSTLNNCTLSGNSASSGGGTFAGTLNNCTLFGNSANSGGGAIGIGAANATLNNCRLSGNSAAAGGGTYGEGCYLNNCTVYGNGNGGQELGTARNTISYGNSGYDMSGVAASFCYTNDPLFVSAAAGNLRLRSNSPCINTGWNAFAPTNVTPYDLDGNPRIYQGLVDKGAYEYQGTDFYNLYASSGPHGSIIPSGTIRTNEGADVIFVMRPSAFYHVSSVATNGTSVGVPTNFTWQNVTAPGTITVSFAETTATQGTPHWWLAQYGWTQNFDVVEAADQDDDGLYTWQEYPPNTCPTNPNTDGDQYSDGVEVNAGADPLNDDSQNYAAILSHPASFSLYTSNSVMDLSYGELMMNAVSNNLRLRLRLQGTYELQGTNWTNFGDAVEWVCPLSSNKYFFRFLATHGD